MNIINYSIIVFQENVVLDGGGFCLQGERVAQGITIEAANYVTVKNFNIKSFSEGVRILGSTNCIVINNMINNCNTGIEINSNPFYKKVDYLQIASVNNCITENEIANCSTGIGLYGGSFNSLTRNVVRGSSDRGIYLSSDSNAVTLNIISGNDKGIVADHCTNNTVKENNLESNSQAIVLTNLGGGATNNLFYMNNFIDNYEIAVPPDYSINRVITPNFWDNGSVGNYWSDYDGSGKYFINKNNIDHYPISKQIDIDSITPTPTPTSLINNFVSPLTIAIIVAIIILIGSISLLLSRRYRKTAKPS